MVDEWIPIGDGIRVKLDKSGLYIEQTTYATEEPHIEYIHLRPQVSINLIKYLETFLGYHEQ